MRLNARAYPYPVLGRRGDFPNDSFDVEAELEQEGEVYRLTAKISCSNEFLQTMVDRGQAQFVVHIECAQTMYRAPFVSTVPEIKASIPLGDLVGAVEMNTMMTATDTIDAYKPRGMHPYFGDQSFHVGPGDILAVAETVRFDVNPDARAGTVAAFMHVMRAPMSGDVPMQVDFSTDKIAVVLSEKDFELYQRIKRHPDLSQIVSTLFVLPALVEAIRMLGEGEEERLEGRSRWMDALENRLAELDLRAAADMNECLEQAQAILEAPLRRSLEAAERMAWADS